MQVISNLKLQITDEDEDSRSFSLDNDSRYLEILRTCKFLAVIQTLFTTITPHETVFVKLSIPFAADEISNCMQEKEFTNVKAAVELADNPNFHFLKDWDLLGPFFIWQLKLYSIPLLPRTDLRYVESYRFRQ